LWLLMGLACVVFALATRRFILAGVLVAAGATAIGFLPQQAKDRLTSLEKILEGHAEDSSGVKRQDRIQDALHSTVSNPFGGGWASAGWVHSDFLQISANLGLAPGLLLLMGYLSTLVRVAVRLWFLPRNGELTALGLSVFLSLIVVGQMLPSKVWSSFPSPRCRSG
jgi:O-antigen ligase